MLSYLIEKAQESSRNKEDALSWEDEKYIRENKDNKYFYSRKQVFSVLKDYTEKMTTPCCESLLPLQLK